MSQQAVGSKFKKNKVIEDQAQADTSKSDHERSNDLASASDAVPAAALGGSKAFAAMLSEAQGAAGAGAEAAKAGGAAAAGGAAGGGISSGLLIAGGLGILGGVAAAVGGGKGGSSTPTPPANQVPTFSAAEVAVSVDEDKPLNNSVKATDGNGDALTYAVGTKPANGTVAVNADGTYVYTPNANYSGADSFTVSVSDGKGGTATQTVKVTVNSVNDAPVVSGPVTASATEDGAAVTVNGLANASDVDAGTTLSVTNVATLPAGVTQSGNSFTLDPANAAYQSLVADETKTVTVNYSVSDGAASTAASAVFTVTGTNDGPKVTSSSTAAQGAVTEAGNLDDGSVVAGTASATGSLTSSDVDTNATKAWSVVGTSDATYGSFAVNADTGVWTYTLNNALAATQALKEGESKTLTYTVRVTDDKGAYADQAVLVVVNGTNDVPVVTNAPAAAQGAVTEAGNQDDGTVVAGIASATGTLTSSDVDANATKSWSVVGTSDATYGSFAVNADTGVWTYTLNNALAATQALKEGESKTLTYTVRVTDDKGAYSDQAVSVVVNGTNDLPVRSAIADTSVTFQEAAPAATTASSQFVKVAGTDADGGVVTFTIPVQPTYGNITLAPDGSGFTYTPKDINYHGSETFTVRLIDAQGNGKYTDYPVTVNVTPNIAENQAIDNGLSKVAYNAAGSGYTAGDNFTFIDDSAQTTNVEIVNFALGDKIQVSASASKYSFAVTTAGDLEITYIDNASGASNVVLVKGIAANAGFIYDETTAEAQLGLGNFFVSLADGASNAAGTTVSGTSLDVDSDSNVNTFALFNASAGNITYTDDAAQANRALIQGFGAGDTITVSNAALSAYSFARDTNAGNDVVITYNNGGTINEIVLQGVAVGATGPLDTLSAVEALVGAGFFKSTSSGTGGSGGTFTPTATQIIDNASGISTYNAGTSSVKFTDDAGVRSDVVLQNFGSDDRIFTNTALNNYSFAISDTDSKDLVITFNNNGVPNQIVLDEILAGKDVFIDNYDSAKAAIGFDFMVFG